MFPLYNFNNADISFRYYGGSDKKSSIKLNEHDYMVKFASPVGKRNNLNTSISNSVISEFIACHIIESMGYPVQKTLLGTINEQVVVACKDFTSPTEKLVEFSKIENRIIDSSDRGRVPALCNIEQIFTGNALPSNFGKEASNRYWDIFIIDSLIGNFDRHSGNWGYLVNEVTGEFQNAPIYDCGSSLYPQLSDDSLRTILQSEEEINKRINVFPKAALTLTPGEGKVGYKDFILSGHKDCTDALLRVAPRISMQKIADIIDNTPVISDIRKEFYQTMLSERYHQIILEPYLQITKEMQKEAPASLDDMIKEAEREASLSGKKNALCRTKIER